MNKREFEILNPQETSRGEAFSLWMTSPMPAAVECKSLFLDDLMIVGTSAMTATELDCIVNQYTDKFFNPMVMWGKYLKGLIRTTLPISFQFHHVQMDGGDGARFLEELQVIIQRLCPPGNGCCYRNGIFTHL